MSVGLCTYVQVLTETRGGIRFLRAELLNRCEQREGTELGTSARAILARNDRAISPVPCFVVETGSLLPSLALNSQT